MIMILVPDHGINNISQVGQHPSASVSSQEGRRCGSINYEVKLVDCQETYT